VLPPQAWTFGLMLMCSAAATGAVTASAALGRFISADNEPPREYRAYRRLSAENIKLSKRATLEAWTELRAGALRYSIVYEEGAESVRTRVLRAALQAEAKAFAERGPERSRLSPVNYEFGEPERMSDQLWRVSIKPRRADVLLLTGAAILSLDGDLIRLEGEPAKKPSFWISRLRIVREYAYLGGARVPVRVTCDASLKLMGAATFEMTYDYESVNGRPVVMPVRLQPDSVPVRLKPESTGGQSSYRSWLPQAPR
jgi:hypothetical protein